MDNQVCVCGHPVSAHQPLISGGEPVILDGVGGLLCGRLQPCLPWPDSEGFYWCDNPKLVVEATTFSIIGGDPHEYCVHFAAAYHRDDWEQRYGPARFTKLLEQNPFGDENG